MEFYQTLELLVQKHSEPRDTSPDILIQGPTRPILPVANTDMDESVIVKASMLTNRGHHVLMQSVGAEL